MYYVKYENSNIKKTFQLNLNELDLISPSFDVLRGKTGVYIDIYGNGTRVYSEHLQIIVDELKVLHHNKVIQDFSVFLKEAIEKKEVLIFDGL